MTYDTPSGEIPVTADEAIAVLDHHRHNGYAHPPPPCDPVPWYRELRGPLWLLGGAGLLGCLALVLMSILVLRTDTLSREDQDREDCFQAFTSSVNGTASATRRAINDLLIAIVGIETAPTGPDAPDVGQQLDSLREFARAARARGDDEAASLRERQDWLMAGSPLPCPIDTGFD